MIGARTYPEGRAGKSVIVTDTSGTVANRNERTVIPRYRIEIDESNHGGFRRAHADAPRSRCRLAQGVVSTALRNSARHLAAGRRGTREGRSMRQPDNSADPSVPPRPQPKPAPDGHGGDAQRHRQMKRAHEAGECWPNCHLCFHERKQRGELCAVDGCARTRVRGITVCATHERAWDTRWSRAVFDAMSADEKHADWQRFLREREHAA